MTDRRSFLKRFAGAVLATVAAVYAPSCLRVLEPVEEGSTLPRVTVLKLDELNERLDILGRFDPLRVNWVLHSSPSLNVQLDVARSFTPQWAYVPHPAT